MLTTAGGSAVRRKTALAMGRTVGAWVELGAEAGGRTAECFDEGTGSAGSLGAFGDSEAGGAGASTGSAVRAFDTGPGGSGGAGVSTPPSVFATTASTFS